MELELYSAEVSFERTLEGEKMRVLRYEQLVSIISWFLKEKNVNIYQVPNPAPVLGPEVY